MQLLFESALGFCLFQTTASSKDYAEIRSIEDLQKLVSLTAVHQFQSTNDAVSEMSQVVKGSIGEGLQSFLVKNLKGGKELMVQDKKLGKELADKLNLKVVHAKQTADDGPLDLFRAIREHLAELLKKIGVQSTDLQTMALGLSHQLSRFKLKFSPNKVDVMVIQAISLLDDVDKELNTYAMRVKEWYGWHFPELSRVVNDNLAYAKLVKHVGFRTDITEQAVQAFVPEEIIPAVISAAQLSMGTEISETDLLHIQGLADQVIELSTYRSDLYDYLRNRMMAIAPNMTALVGELVGARLIAKAGSLMNLAKYPASTVQILGAEKALFRALKTKHDTPKYGLLYHTSIVGSAPPKLKGQMARMVANRAALSIRYDALAEDNVDENGTIGQQGRLALEARLRSLESGSNLQSMSNYDRKEPKFSYVNNGGSYNTATDQLALIASEPLPGQTNGFIEDSSRHTAEGERKKSKKEKKRSEQEPKPTETETEEERAKREKKAAKKAAKEAARSEAKVAGLDPSEKKKKSEEKSQKSQKGKIA